MTTQSRQINHLQRLVTAGIANDAEREELRRLLSEDLEPAPPPQASQSTGSRAAANPPEAPGFISLNTDAFLEGWGEGNVAPSDAGVYQSVCDGWMIPTGEKQEGQVWFWFKNAAGETTHRGALVCAAVTREERSGAGKVKQVLDVLGARYEIVMGRGVRILSPIKGLRCKTVWAWVQVDGQDQLRIQDIVALDSATESL